MSVGHGMLAGVAADAAFGIYSVVAAGRWITTNGARSSISNHGKGKR